MMHAIVCKGEKQETNVLDAPKHRRSTPSHMHGRVPPAGSGQRSVFLFFSHAVFTRPLGSCAMCASILSAANHAPSSLMRLLDPLAAVCGRSLCRLRGCTLVSNATHIRVSESTPNSHAASQTQRTCDRRAMVDRDFLRHAAAGTCGGVMGVYVGGEMSMVMHACVLVGYCLRV